MGTLFVDPLVTGTDATMNILQIDWLQPILHADVQQRPDCLPGFHGHRRPAMDVGFVMARPFQSMIIALFAELRHGRLPSDRGMLSA